MTLAYIGLGSNLSDPAYQIQLAVHALRGIDKSKVSQLSSLYCSRPMGPQDQPDYINAVAILETQLSAIDLLDSLQSIENKAGRVRKDNRWGARILDLDILLFGDQIIETPRLTVPHYGLSEREFVLIPLHEIRPELTLPSGENVTDLVSNIPSNGLKIHSQLA